jgi:hypothetical protein
VGLRFSVPNCFEGALGTKESSMVLDNNYRSLGSSFSLDIVCPMDEQLDSGRRYLAFSSTRLRDHSRLHRSR